MVTFEPPAVTGPQQVPQPCVVYISQVVTETELVAQSHQLQQALASRQFVEFCTLKATNSSDVMQENIWNFIRVYVFLNHNAVYIHYVFRDVVVLKKHELLVPYLFKIKA